MGIGAKGPKKHNLVANTETGEYSLDGIPIGSALISCDIHISATGAVATLRLITDVEIETEAEVIKRKTPTEGDLWA